MTGLQPAVGRQMPAVARVNDPCAKSRSEVVTWATLNDYAAKREDLLWRAKEVQDWIAEGTLKVQIARTLPLVEAVEAHRLIESRRVVGKVLLQP